ncbi:transferrin-binding protein-like solute binding protein [Palleronia caenipelagi]|uniref:Transferrin-binding protein-like solute binding protein n=1 Tax=Palleronia caenipelagi TaxID=2489174 RepID=A0A547Q5Q0_9RHOB|nr:transferrin-binding protein-like solute binding protein [Palleronia caenipelagi]TRD21726.1 transferrin-binding protein-like solute binding protein [Palleronia caenipelagi]
MRLTATILILTLTACGGGGGGGSSDDDNISSGGGKGGTDSGDDLSDGPTNLRYTPLSAGVDRRSALTGVAVRVGSGDGDLALTRVTGSRHHGSDDLRLNIDGTSFRDADGADLYGRYRSGDAVVAIDGRQGFDGDYSYVTAYDHTYRRDGTDYAASGIVGIATDPADLPSSGQATYTGEAVVSTVRGGRVVRYGMGTSRVSADFGTGRVDATLGDFGVVSHSVDGAVGAQLDTVRLQNMRIDGNRFSGGTVRVERKGSTVDLTGVNTRSQSQGVFYGGRGDVGPPDEVGGVFTSQGASGRVTGAYLAD